MYNELPVNISEHDLEQSLICESEETELWREKSLKWQNNEGTRNDRKPSLPENE